MMVNCALTVGKTYRIHDGSHDRGYTYKVLAIGEEAIFVRNVVMGNEFILHHDSPGVTWTEVKTHPERWIVLFGEDGADVFDKLEDAIHERDYSSEAWSLESDILHIKTNGETEWV